MVACLSLHTGGVTVQLQLLKNPGHKRFLRQTASLNAPMAVAVNPTCRSTHYWHTAKNKLDGQEFAMLVVTASENVPDEYVLPDNRTIAPVLPNSPLVACQIAQQLGFLGYHSAPTRTGLLQVDGCGSLKQALQADLTLDRSGYIVSTIVDCNLGDEPRICAKRAANTTEIFAIVVW